MSQPKGSATNCPRSRVQRWHHAVAELMRCGANIVLGWTPCRTVCKRPPRPKDCKRYVMLT